jgi:predicted RNase H-like HicB family nuclease
MRYAVVIEGKSDNCSAYAPDLPGCVSVGATLEEVLAEMQQAFRFHLDGLRADNLPIPAPTSVVDYIEA